ncbi:MAG TPA: SpoIID/LytB domain-containing protein [Gaiellaceae bacterium]|nr:SpoIID/LytB domain-containing protein [Gaiellaceae bacterium]
MSRGLVLTAGVLAALLAAGLGAAGSRRTTQAEAAARPGTPVFVITGRGWGHGVGMSQWGANGFARRGYDYRRILAHYYRGTTIGRAPIAKVRVLLAASKPTLTIASEEPFRVRDATGRTRTLAAKQVIGAGLKVQPQGARRRVALRPPLVFLPGDEPLQLGRRYRGTIQVDKIGKRLRAINVVGLEQYLYGVVPAEVPDDWPAEVLKAQAVAARSYALATRKTTGPFDLFPDVRSQVYRGVDEEENSTNDAVDETAGEVLVYGGRLVTAYFHSTSGGRTASVEDVWAGSKPTPYLTGVDDPYDSISPHHVWGPIVMPAARLQRVLKAPGRLLDVRTTINDSLRADTVVGVGATGEGSAKAADVRRELGLRSTWFRFGVLALSQPARPHVFGGTTRLTGTARGVRGVKLEHFGPTGWRVVASPRAAPDGTFSVAVRPTATARYRLSVGSARTPAIRLGVAPQLRLRPVTDAMELRGTMRPAIVGTPVEIQRLSGRTWGTVGRATVAEDGSFSAPIYVPPGSYRARAPSPGRGLVAGTSPTMVVNG